MTGFAWGRHDHDLFHGTERFFRPGYQANLVSSWIPALTGVEAKLVAGARVADVGCGHGASTLIMAEAYPASTFVGFDPHEPLDRRRPGRGRRRPGSAIGSASRWARPRTSAAPAGTWSASSTASTTWATRSGPLVHTRAGADPDGSVLLVEPFAGDRLEDNLNPVGRVFYAASTLICTPASQSQEVGLALGAQAGDGACGRPWRPRPGCPTCTGPPRHPSTWCSRSGPDRLGPHDGHDLSDAAAVSHRVSWVAAAPSSCASVGVGLGAGVGVGVS